MRIEASGTDMMMKMVECEMVCALPCEGATGGFISNRPWNIQLREDGRKNISG